MQAPQMRRFWAASSSRAFVTCDVDGPSCTMVEVESGELCTKTWAGVNGTPVDYIGDLRNSPT